MSQAQSAMRNYTRTLLAGVEIILDVPGANFVQCTSGTANFTISPDGQNPVTLANGLGMVYNETFDKLRVISATNQTIELYIGSGSIIDNRAISSGIGTSRSQSNQSASAPAAATVGTSSAQIVAVNTGRSSCLIQNLGPGVVYIGNGVVTVANGIRIAVNGSMSVTWDDAIHGISTIAATDVRFVDETV